MMNNEFLDDEYGLSVVVDMPPYDQIGALMRPGVSLDDLSKVANGYEGAWSIVRAAAYSERLGTKFSKIGVLPFVTTGMKVANHVMVRALTEYLSKVSVGTVTFEVRSQPLHYSEFSSVDPRNYEAMRYQLLDVQSAAHQTVDGTAASDQEWPTLLLLVFLVTRDGGHPILRHDPKALASLLMELGLDANDVIEPEFIDSDVITDGVMKWLNAMSLRAKFETWDVIPRGDDVVVVEVTGELGDQGVRCGLCLRSSQLAESGVADVLRHVAAMAGNFGHFGEQRH